MNLPQAIKVLIVDDHDLIRTGLRYMLADESNIDVVGEAVNGEDGIRFVNELAPNVVLLDIKMPGIGGIEAANKMLKTNPCLKILMVSVCDDGFFPVTLSRIGVLGYLTKNSNKDELLHAIYKVNSGQRYLSPTIKIKTQINKTGCFEDSPFENLSKRELEITLMIANGEHVKQVAAKLNINHKTVHSYRYRIFTKLKIKTNVELALLAKQHSLID